MTSDEEFEAILESHIRNPQCYGIPASVRSQARRENRLCGDVVEVFQDDNTTEFSFIGKGCVISQASASLVLSAVRESSAQPTELVSAAESILLGKNVSEDPRLSGLAPLCRIARFPLRRKCSLLVVECLKELLDAETSVR